MPSGRTAQLFANPEVFRLLLLQLLGVSPAAAPSCDSCCHRWPLKSLSAPRFFSTAIPSAASLKKMFSVTLKNSECRFLASLSVKLFSLSGLYITCCTLFSHLPPTAGMHVNPKWQMLQNRLTFFSNAHGLQRFRALGLQANKLYW